MAVKYDTMGNRVWKSSTMDGVTTTWKYIVDINGQLPVILCELDAADPNIFKRSYIYADAQVLAQREHTDPDVPGVYEQRFYVHDRLGSVRLVIAPLFNEQTQTWLVSAANAYVYTPFGSFYDGQCIETVANPFKFTSQWHDVEIDQYYLRARMYDPKMMRFTARDLVNGKNYSPLTLHKYLYCLNNSTNNTDASGRLGQNLTGAIIGGYALHGVALGTAAYGVATGNDTFLKAGIAMEGGIAIGMAIGAALENPKIILNAIKLYAVVSIIDAATPEGAADGLGELCGDPQEPTTITGFNVKMSVLSH